MTNIKLWHGGARWVGCPEIRLPRKDRYEHGCGLYLSTGIETAKRYAKGSNVLTEVEISRDVRWLEGACLPFKTITQFVSETKFRNKKQLLADLERSAERVGAEKYPAAYLVNLVVNNESGAGVAGQALAEFLATNRIHASLVHQSVEDWVVVFDSKIILKWQVRLSSEIDWSNADFPLIKHQLN